MQAACGRNTEKSDELVRDDFARTVVATSTRASTLGERGRRGRSRPAVECHQDGKKQRLELKYHCSIKLWFTERCTGERE